MISRTVWIVAGKNNLEMDKARSGSGRKLPVPRRRRQRGTPLLLRPPRAHRGLGVRTDWRARDHFRRHVPDGRRFRTGPSRRERDRWEPGARDWRAGEGDVLLHAGDEHEHGAPREYCVQRTQSTDQLQRE